MVGVKVIVSIIAVVFFSKRLIKKKKKREREREKKTKEKKRKEKLIQSNKNDYVTR